MTYLEQIVVADEVLYTLSDFIDNQACIAGGAPRNWYSEKLANDIDIYLRSRAVSSKYTAKKLLNKVLGDDIVFQETSTHELKQYDHGKHFGICVIVSFLHKNVLFQVMFLDENTSIHHLPSSVMESFDTGITMCYRIEEQTHYTEAFKQDMENKTITLFPDNMPDNQLRHCLKVHVPKLMGYYPEHRLVVK